MKGFRWSWLYPGAWQKEFGIEFDEMIEQSGVTWRSALDIVWHAIRLRCMAVINGLPLPAAWLLIAWLNIVAREVQWPAGALVASAFALTIWRRDRWLRMTLTLFCSIPISSLYFYQIPHIHHEPLYKTLVALIPAFVGACLGLIVAPRNPSENMKA